MPTTLRRGSDALRFPIIELQIAQTNVKYTDTSVDKHTAKIVEYSMATRNPSTMMEADTDRWTVLEIR